MWRRGSTGKSGYGLGGLVPPAPASPAGKFLGADGRWSTPGGGGVTDHAGLSSLYWTASGHTSTPGMVAYFMAGTGAASTIAVGTGTGTLAAGDDPRFPSSAIHAALTNAAAPTGSNPFATVGDVNTSGAASVAASTSYAAGLMGAHLASADPHPDGLTLELRTDTPPGATVGRAWWRSDL